MTDFEHGFKLGVTARVFKADQRLVLGVPVRGRSPTISVYLAKDFGFKRLFGFLASGDSENQSGIQVDVNAPSAGARHLELNRTAR